MRIRFSDSGCQPALMKLGRFVSLLSALLALSACFEAPDIPAAQRLIEEESQGILKFPSMKNLSWDFSVADDRRSWQFGGPGHRLSESPQGLNISSGGRCSFSAAFQFAAVTTGQIELEMSGLRRGDHFSLFWDDGMGFSSGRSIGFKVVGDQDFFVLNPEKSDTWRGVVYGLRIIVESPEKRTLELRRIRVVRDHRWYEKVKRLAVQSWKIDGSGDVRNGVLGVEGKPIRWNVRFPRKALLEFSCARFGPPGAPIVFSVFRRESAGGLEEIFNQSVGSEGDVEGSPWRDFSLTIESRAGEDSTLELRVEKPASTSGEEGIAAWGNPVLIDAERDSTRPDILLISIDTLRADRLGTNGRQDSLSPNIDRWASGHAFVFQNCVAPSPWTLPSHVSMLSGLGPFSHPFHYSMRVGSSIRTLAEILREDGYSTMALTGGGYLRPRFGFAQGFDRYKYWIGPKGEELPTHVDEALSWLRREESQPRFMFLHSFEVHGPYAPAEPFFSKRTGGRAWPKGWQIQNVGSEGGEEKCFARDKINVLRRIDASGFSRQPTADEEGMLPLLYDSHVEKMDEQIGKLIRGLEARGLMEKMYVALTADHGEGLGEKGLFGHAYLYDFNLMVPFILSGPEIEGPGRSESQVRLIDLMPTLLDLAGIGHPEGIDGYSLRPLLEGGKGEIPDDALSYAASTCRGISIRRANREKYIFNNAASNCPQFRDEMYDLLSDPGESENLINSSDDRRGFQDQVLSAYAHALTGVEIDVRNTGLENLVIRFSGGAFRKRKLKLTELPLQEIRWSGPSEGLHLSPGTRAVLRLEGPREGRLSLDVLAEGEGRLHGVGLQLEKLHEPAIFCDAGGRWRRCDFSEVTEASGGVIIIRPPAGDPGEPLEPDAEATRQLRALGYVE